MMPLLGFFGRALAWALTVLGVLGATLISPRIHTPVASAPEPADARAVQDLMNQVRRVTEARRGAPAITLSPAILASTNRLAQHGVGWLRTQGLATADSFEARASLVLSDHAAINGLMRIGTRLQGFLDITLQAGAITVTPAMVRNAAKVALRILDVPQEEQDINLLLPSTLMQGDTIRIPVAIPPSLRNRTREQLAGLRGSPPLDRVMAHYAAILALQPAPGLTPMPFAAMVRAAFSNSRAWAGQSSQTTEAQAAFMALAMATIGIDVGRMSGLSQPARRQCTPSLIAGMLHGRRDLAQHWSLSAALTFGFSDRLSAAAGEWKELRDSTAGGSGFSFVDLTADRGGLRVALGLRGARTTELVKALSTVEAAGLLPASALTRLQEGLTEKQFVRRYGTIETAQYRRTVAEVDALLDTLPLYQGLPHPKVRE